MFGVLGFALPGTLDMAPRDFMQLKTTKPSKG